MKNRIIPLFAITLCITILTVTPSKKNEIYAETEDKKVQIFARNGQNEGIVKVEREYTGLNIKWKSTTAYEGKHVRVIGSVIPDEGKDYVDLSQYTRLEYEVREGVTKEYFAPSYIDSDGTYVIVGTVDGNSSTAGTKINYKGDLTYPNNNGTYDGLKGTNYCGSPVWMTEGNEDFANYHFNIDNASVKTYTDWASGLTLTSNGEANKDKIKCFAINMIKQKNNREFDWDFSVLKVYGRDALGNKKLIFDASNAEMTDSISTVWTNNYALTQKSYVYVQNNLESNYSDFEATINTSSKYTASETQPGDSFKIIKKNGGSMWGWSRLLEAEKGAIVDCSEYDAAIFELNNTTGYPLSLKPRYDYDNGSGVVNCDAGQLTLVGEDGTITETVNYVIPAGFKGTVYSFFTNALNNFSSNLAYVKNDFRMVITINDENNGKTFELSNYRFTKTGLNQYKAQVCYLIDQERAKYDDVEYTSDGVAKLDKIVTDTKAEINECKTFNNIRGIYNNNIETFKSVDVKEVELRENAVNEIESYVDLNNYYEEEKEIVESLIESAKTSINAVSIDEIDTIVASTKSFIDQVKTKADIDASILVDKKVEAKAKIENYISDLTLYRENEKLIISSIISNTNSEIELVQTIEQLHIVVSNAKARLDEVKTDGELLLEEFEIAKLNSINEIEEFVDLTNYYHAEKESVIAIINNTKLLVESVSNISEITPIINESKNQINLIKTKAVIDAENLAKKKIEAKAEIQQYKNAEEYFENELLIISDLKQQANLRIDNCDTVKKVEILVEKLKEEIDLVPNKEVATDLQFEKAKEDSLKIISTYVDFENYYQEQVNEINSIINSSPNIINSSKNTEELSNNIKEIQLLIDLVKTRTEIDEDRIKVEIENIVSKVDSYVSSLNLNSINEQQITEINELYNQYLINIKNSNDITQATELEVELYNKINLIINATQDNIPEPKDNQGILIVALSSISVLVVVCGIVIAIMLKRKAI